MKLLKLKISLNFVESFSVFLGKISERIISIKLSLQLLFGLKKFGGKIDFILFCLSKMNG